jgi:LysR family glycine cleavage system transcriptional activator
MQRIPGLAALRVFEAAARHLGFTPAAAELGVTPAAVSNQIRGLEDQLGVRLFARTSRSMRLTRPGETLFAGVTEAFAVLGRTIERIGVADRNTLSVTTSASFAGKWLVPRLERFRLLHPGVVVRIDASDRQADLAEGEAHVAIRFGRGDDAGLRAWRLFDEFIFPVCSPALLTGGNPLRTPDDLRHHTLIHLDWHARADAWPDWRSWLLAAGVDGIDAARGLYLNRTDLILQAAVAGQGVALGNTSLVGDDLASGRLARPFDLSLKAEQDFAYYLVVPSLIADRALIAAFRDWVLAETAAGAA